MSDAASTLEHVFRTESGPVLATLIRLLGDFQLAEDALQDAAAAALETWAKDGVPAAPAAWLTTTARRKAVDRLRHLRIVEAKRSELALTLRLARSSRSSSTRLIDASDDLTGELRAQAVALLDEPPRERARRRPGLDRRLGWL